MICVQKNTLEKGSVKKMITESIKKVKSLFKGMLERFSGGEKRRAAAEIALAYGQGGQTYVAKEFGMGRDTIRKGIKEIETGVEIKDKYNQRGRKSTLEKNPQLENQLHQILRSQSQADPKFKTERLYTNLSAEEIRIQLMKQYEYADEDLPGVRTLNTILNKLGYNLKSVMKAKPKKKILETDLIFYNLQRIHNIADEDENIVRLSIDTKDRVKIGEFSRGGKNRIEVKALDHDFGGIYVVPFGIYNVKEKTAEISICETKVTADFIVDRIEEYWVSNGYSNTGKTLLLNSDNGPESNGRRTQFLKRIVEFSMEHNTPVILVYYPPYHSKYNPVERLWGTLEQHWNGDLLDTKEAVIEFTKSMKFDQKNPKVTVVDETYETGVKVKEKLMRIYEKALERMAGLEDWYIQISPDKCKEICKSLTISV